jgi:putative tryptophan/tyrosine transport system substrate-binding protein
MNRREVIGGLILPLLLRPASAQPASMPVVAFVTPGYGPGSLRYLDAFRRGLQEASFFVGRNVAIEHHHVEGKLERLPELIADLVRRRVAVICTITNVVALAVKAANSDVPLVFAFGLDPVEMGLVASINRPGGSATGVFFPVTALEPKRLELLQKLVPQLQRVAVLVNPANPNADMKQLDAVARSVGLELLVLKANDASEIDTAFATLLQWRARALLVTSDPVFENQRQLIFSLAASGAIPAIYPWREYADAGGLLSYGNNLTDAARLVGVYAGRILNGDKPGELPVQVPTKFELVINLKTARALGLDISPTLLATADEVIE